MNITLYPRIGSKGKVCIWWLCISHFPFSDQVRLPSTSPHSSATPSRTRASPLSGTPTPTPTTTSHVRRGCRISAGNGIWNFDSIRIMLRVTFGFTVARFKVCVIIIITHNIRQMKVVLVVVHLTFAESLSFGPPKSSSPLSRSFKTYSKTSSASYRLNTGLCAEDRCWSAILNLIIGLKLSPEHCNT